MLRHSLLRPLALAGLLATLLAYPLADARAAVTQPVTIVHFHYTPKTLIVHAGDTVTWSNDQPNIPHTTVSDTGLWHSGPLSNGRTFSLTFTKPGTYTYHCTLQTATLSMHGTIIVVQ
jgi:plastocyanin